MSPARAHRRCGVRRAARRGFTVVELMMSLALLAVGITGIIASQRVTLEANLHARDVATANFVAAAWLEQLRIDAAAWNHPSELDPNSDLNETLWLKSTPGEWTAPTPGRSWSRAFDQLGNPIAPDADPPPRFCSHVHLTDLYGNAPGYGRIRATVRVFWARGGADPSEGFCDADASAASAQQATRDYHFVYHTTVIAQQTAQRH